ncbi:MAG: hypothetical protein DRP25_03955, partial [Thermotoga sp.]
MSRNVRSKTLAIFVTTILVVSATVFITPVKTSAKYEDIQGYDKIPGVNVWQGANWTVANMPNATVLKTSTKELYYGNQVVIEVNSSLNWGSDTYFLYYPVYTGKWPDGNYNLTWKKYEPAGYPAPSIGGDDNQFGDGGEAPVILNVSGLWLIDNDDVHDCSNFSRMNETVPAWFWVNASTEYTVTVSDTSFPYDSTGELTIDVDHGTDEQPAVMIDIRADNGTSIFVKNQFASTGELSVSKNSSKFKWAGNYTIYVYMDTDDAGTDIYYFEGTDYHRHYSEEYGNSTTFTSYATYYNYSLCGPWDPPEYNATPIKIVVESGVPTLTIPEENATMYWSFPGEVNISVKDYEGENISIPTNESIVVLNDDRDNVTANFTIDYGNGYVRIYPKNQTEPSGWGRDGSYVYGNNGTWRAWIRWDKNGDGIYEWNGTAIWTVTKAPSVQIQIISPSNKEISEIPDINNQPMTVKFKVFNRNHEYLGDGNQDEDMKNITLAGDALFIGDEGKTLYEYSNMFSNVVYYDDTSNTWWVNITPTMDLNGGELKISVDWGNWGTREETIFIGGTKLNGSVVTISPTEFTIGENVTITVKVTDANGYPYPNANVALYYVNDSGGLEYEINATSGGGTTSGEYTFLFNVTQQTNNQTNVWSEIKAPRYIAAYVELPNVGGSPPAYGYAVATMKPRSDLKVEISKDILMAGKKYDLWINISTVDPLTGNKTGTPDDTNLHVEIYNETGVNVTNKFDSWGWSPLNNDVTIKLSDVYALEPGTYYIYAYNSTHDSEGFNATFEVVPVEVTADVEELIWNYDDNITVTFTVTWQGEPVNGTLQIIGIQDVGSYNQTWVNATLQHELTVENGVAVIHNVTANNLTNASIQNITFKFKPEDGGGYANATGVVLVKVPDVEPTPDAVAVGEMATVNVLVTGRGQPLPGVNVTLKGAGIKSNATTDASGVATFSILPGSTGYIDILIENRSTGTKINVTANYLEIEIPSSVQEGIFTVTIKDGKGYPVKGAQVKFTGTGETKITDSNG